MLTNQSTRSPSQCLSSGLARLPLKACMHSLKLGRSSGACAHGSAMDHEDHVKQRPQKSTEHFTNRRQSNCHSNGDCKAFHRKNEYHWSCGAGGCIEALILQRTSSRKKIPGSQAQRPILNIPRSSPILAYIRISL